MAETPAEPDRRRRESILSAAVPLRLAAPLDGPVSDAVFGDFEHRLVSRQALDWQPTAGRARFWEMAAHGAVEGMAYALAGQMASAGEQLALAYSAAFEVALWRVHRERTEPPDPTSEMSMRGMAEAQSMFVIGTGHAFANVGLRALAMDGTLLERLIAEFGQRRRRPPTFDPFSNDPSNWLSLNRFSCEKLRSVAAASGRPEVIALISPIVDLGTSALWAQLTGRRGVDFHRWRPQSHGLLGVKQAPPWEHADRERFLSIGSPDYREAEGLADAVADLATRGMIELARHMERFIDCFRTASPILGGPTFTPSTSDAPSR